MKKLSLPIILTIISLILSSCATMLNSNRTSLTINTSIPCKLVVNKDTVNNYITQKNITVERDKKPLVVTAFNDSLTKTIIIDSKNSFAYWLNLYPNWHLWTGFIIDTKTKKRYTYPTTIYIDLVKKDSSYLTFIPLAKPYDKYLNIIKITPLKSIGIVNPGLEISFERKFSNYFTTQLMASYLFSISVWDLNSDFKSNTKGYRFAIEEKYYFKNSAPIGPYISLEFDYLRNQYHDIVNFSDSNILSVTSNNNYYFDTIGIRKKTYSFNFKLGYQIVIKRFSVDFYAGLGARYKDVVHTDKLKPNDEMEQVSNIRYITNKNGQFWTISTPLNIRLGWTF